ncbi:MAG: response regulator transcription factor [Coriobacteriaceae bacterium]|nr:response regulator transcription factor [Coriobacteriaceae bacterium]
MRMLVVDDEVDIANMLAEYFRMEGHDVVVAQDGASALEAVSAGKGGHGAFDIILLDVNMPGMDGFEVCRRIREHLSCPILFLTARVEDVDQIDGFAAGADDYVLKPFSLEVLGHRVAAHVAREGRARSQEQAVRFFRGLTIDYASRTVEVAGAAVDLTKLEFDLVALLSKRPGQVFDREAIYERVWGWDAAGDPGQVREHIRRIRNKFAAAGLDEDPIETVWGVGYKWVAK